jgi:outer membrane protein assembly factor BamA
MKSGEIAGRERIEAGLMNVSAGYLKYGFIEYRLLSASPVINEQNLNVDYRVEISEGKQYRMDRFLGSYTAGLSLPFGKLSKQWRLKAGELFDDLYFDEFKEKCFKPWRQTYAPDIELSLMRIPDRAKMTVSIKAFLLQKK